MYMWFLSVSIIFIYLFICLFVSDYHTNSFNDTDQL